MGRKAAIWGHRCALEKGSEILGSAWSASPRKESKGRRGATEEFYLQTAAQHAQRGREGAAARGGEAAGADRTYYTAQSSVEKHCCKKSCVFLIFFFTRFAVRRGTTHSLSEMTPNSFEWNYCA